MCLEKGITLVQVLPAKVGVRTTPVVRLSPLDLSLSAQMRVRRRYGSRAYTEESKEFRCEMPGTNDAASLVALVEELCDGTSPSS